MLANKKVRCCSLLAISLLMVLAVTGCSSPEVKTDFSPGRYELVCKNRPLIPQAAFMILKEDTLNSKPVSPQSQRSQEITESMNDLVNLLEASGLFASVEVLDSNVSKGKGFLIEISLMEEEDLHIAGAGASGFASGFLTLGLAPITYKYTYTSNMNLRTTTSSGRTLEKAFTKKAVVSAQHYGGEVLSERPLARKYVTDENNKAAVAYLVEMSQELYK
jgi:hypothetical protein